MGRSEFVVPELVDPVSGRLDAMRVASYLKLSVEDIASMVLQPVGVIRAAPSAQALQERLEGVAFVVGGLLQLLRGQREVALAGLRAPHWALDDDTPLALLCGNELEVVVGLVDDILSGAPA